MVIETDQIEQIIPHRYPCLLYTSDAADERSSVDLGGRRIIKKKNNAYNCGPRCIITNKNKNES